MRNFISILSLLLLGACTDKVQLVKEVEVPGPTIGVTTEVLVGVTVIQGITTVVLPPEPTDVELVITDENDYRLSLGQTPYTRGITCSLYNVMTGATPTPPQPQPANFPTSLPAATATFAYLGEINQADSSAGSQILPLALRPLYLQWYALRCTGSIVILDSGYHNFATISDDASLLYIDNVLVVNNDGQHGMQERSGAKNLHSGIHTIKVDYMAGGGPSGLIVKMDGLTLPMELLYR